MTTKKKKTTTFVKTSLAATACAVPAFAGCLIGGFAGATFIGNTPRFAGN